MIAGHHIDLVLQKKLAGAQGVPGPVDDVTDGQYRVNTHPGEELQCSFEAEIFGVDVANRPYPAQRLHPEAS